MSPSAKKRQRGSSLIMLALLITALFAMAALAVDIGVLYTARTSAQHAADAAAIAGAYTFTNAAATQPDAAINAAIAVAAETAILGQPVTITAADIVVDQANRRVTVNVPRMQDNGGAIATYFAQVIGINTVDVLVQATAEAADSATASRCLKPFFIPNTVLSEKDWQVACDDGEVFFDDAGNLTSYAISHIGQLSNVRPTNPENALEPGQFYSLDFGSGASTYECTIANCLNYCPNVDEPIVRCNAEYPVKTGNMVGPTRQGVDGFLAEPPDLWFSVGQYQDGATGTIKDSSVQLAVAPIWDNCKQQISPGYAGQKVKVVGFSEIFIQGMDGPNVQAYLVNATSCAGAGNAGEGSEVGDNTGPQGVPVRLVQNPAP